MYSFQFLYDNTSTHVLQIKFVMYGSIQFINDANDVLLGRKQGLHHYTK